MNDSQKINELKSAFIFTKVTKDFNFDSVRRTSSNMSSNINSTTLVTEMRIELKSNEGVVSFTRDSTEIEYCKCLSKSIEEFMDSIISKANKMYVKNLKEKRTIMLKEINETAIDIGKMEI